MENKFVNIEDIISSYGLSTTKEQELYLLNIEKIISNSIRDDYALLCNMYKLYKTCKYTKIISADNVNSAIIGSSITLGRKMKFVELLSLKFGLSEKTIYNYLKIADKFIDFLAGENFRVLALKDFSVSKLQELLPLSIETIEQAIEFKIITYQSTRDEIRAYVKSLSSKKSNKVIEDVPEEERQEEQYNPNDIGCYNVELPNEIMEFCKLQMKKKKIDTLSDYLISLIKEQM